MVSHKLTTENRTRTRVETAVRYAIEQGYQISPNALSILVAYEDRTLVQGSSLESLIGSLIVEKVRFEDGESVADGVKTITYEDVRKFLPDVFNSVEQVHSMVDGADGVEHVGMLSDLEVVSDPTDKIQATGTDGFTQLFRSRFEKLAKMLEQRPEARGLERLSEIGSKKGRSRVCGLVLGKRNTKNGVELILDDESGKASVIAMKDDMIKMASEVSLDQCILVDVEQRGSRFIIHSIIQPDVPARIASSSKKTAYAVFLSDLHVGSNRFLAGAFDRFLEWVNSRDFHSDIDEEILTHLKYVVIGGDIVDGVGVFPNQEYELAETSIIGQYEMVSRKLALIPKRVAVVAIPGNHDSTRQALPQPSIPRKYAEALYNLPNVRMLGDPSVVKLDGVSVLVYHGRSLDDVLATTPGLSYEKPAEAMKVLLKARHLAPMFGSRTPIAPESEDRLVIDEVPDIFHAGHVHSVGVDSYRGTLVLNSGTWQGQTTYQANLGVMPRPGLVPIVNLATLEVTLKEFLISGTAETGDAG